ncbi:hypothetical protein [Microbacterium sp. LWH13-1.2]|uniref:hypothetical protein n=1 Tax=Microbacterium sp. LWH13-1.2 TaxID=3135260 RepID=UPI0031398067
MEQRYVFDLTFPTGNPEQRVHLKFEGGGDELVFPLIAAAFARLGRHEDGTTGFLLSPADALDHDQGVEDSQFLLLEGHETAHDLRFLIGPNDDAVFLRTGGWGGTGLPEMYNWVLSDLLPFGRTFLEVYGAVEFIKVAGRAVEARKNRELRREAEAWLRSDSKEVWGLLLDAVRRSDAWPVDDLTRTFALSITDATRLMTVCGYTYDPASRCYYRMNAYPGLFDQLDGGGA